MPQRSLGEIKAEQTQLRTRVGQLVDEAREIEIKMSVDGATDGLEAAKRRRAHACRSWAPSTTPR